MAEIGEAVGMLTSRRGGKPRAEGVGEAIALTSERLKRWLERHPWGIFWLAVLLAPMPLWAVYLGRLWREEHYQFFPFLLLALAALVAARWDRRLGPPRRGVGWGALGGALATLLVAAAIYSPWLAALSLVLGCAAFLFSHVDAQGRRLASLALLPCLLLRLPLGLDQALIFRLQLTTTTISSLALDLLRVPHAAFGNIIELPTTRLFVAEACSGIQSLFTMLFVALLLLVSLRRPVIQLPGLLFFAAVGALAANVLRVCSIAVGEHWWGIDLTEGWRHELLGYGTLIIACVILLSSDQLLQMIFHPIGAADRGSRHNPVISFWNGLLRGERGWDGNGRDGDAPRGGMRAIPTRPPSAWLPMSLSVLFATGLLISLMARDAPTTSGRSEVTGELIFQPSEQLLAPAVGVIEPLGHDRLRGGQDRRLGANADVWSCRVGGWAGEFIVSQPYDGCHDLNHCYQGSGWILQSRQGPQDRRGAAPHATSTFWQAPGAYGYLLFAAIDADGSDVTAVGGDIAESMRTRLGRASGRGRSGGIGFGDTVMVQLWVTTADPLSAEQLTDLSDSFAEARGRVVAALRAQ